MRILVGGFMLIQLVASFPLRFAPSPRGLVLPKLMLVDFVTTSSYDGIILVGGARAAGLCAPFARA